MADHLFVTTAEEEAAITAHRLKNAPNVPDNEAYINGTVRQNILGPAVAAFIEQQVGAVADAYRAASPDERKAAEEALKVTRDPDKP